MQVPMSNSLSLLWRPSSSGRVSRWLLSGGLVGVHGRTGVTGRQGRRSAEGQGTVIVITSFSAYPRTPITVLQQNPFKIHSSRHPHSFNSPLQLLHSASVIFRSKGEDLEERGSWVLGSSEEAVARSMEMRKKAMLWLALACTVGSLGLLVAPGMVHGRDSTPLSFVKKTVASHSIVIFSKSYCPYCKRAKNVFKELKEDPFVVELDQREDGSKIQDALFELVKKRTVPQVFIDGEHIGGSDDTVEAHRSGRLKKLLGSKQSGDQELR